MFEQRAYVFVLMQQNCGPKAVFPTLTDAEDYVRDQVKFIKIDDGYGARYSCVDGNYTIVKVKYND